MNTGATQGDGSRPLKKSEKYGKKAQITTQGDGSIGDTGGRFENTRGRFYCVDKSSNI